MFLANDYEAKFRQIAFSESVGISHGQHLPSNFFSISAFIYAPCLTCNAILRLVYADFTSSERLLVRRNLLGILSICLTVLCNFNSLKNLCLPIGQVKHRIH